MSEEDNQSNAQGSRRRRSSNTSRGSLYSKREQLLNEMQTGDEDQPVSVRQQVENLKSGGSSQVGIEESDWGAKHKRKKGSPWMLWMVLGLVIPIILIGLVLFTSSSRRTLRESDAGTGLDFNVLGGRNRVQPEDWFVENLATAMKSGLSTLEVLSEENLSLEVVSPLVRSGEQAKELIEFQKMGRWPGFDTSDRAKLSWNYGASNATGFLTSTGMKKDFRDFRAYFVKQEEEVRLDLDATEAKSDIPIESLGGMILKESVQLRCWVAKEPYFDARSDEKLFSWYQILAANEVDFVWAYCRRGGDVDEALRKELNYGRLIEERKKQFRAIIKLNNASGFQKDEFLLEELVANEWVLPQF